MTKEGRLRGLSGFDSNLWAVGLFQTRLVKVKGRGLGLRLLRGTVPVSKVAGRSVSGYEAFMTQRPWLVA